MHKAPLIVSGLIFLLAALIHLRRIIDPFEIKIGDLVVPEWFSLFGFIFFLILAIWNFVASKGRCKASGN